jgi:predicted phosphodiesterase
VRVGLISDVHGNLAALEAALEALGEEGIDRLVCAGDLVGYGPFPNECVARVAETGARCVAGNHDLMAIGRLDEAGAGALARSSIAWTRSVLGAEARAYLEALPPTIELDSMMVAHGSLDDPSEYVERERAGAALARLASTHPDASMLVLGHTHTSLAHAERRGTLLHGRRGRVALEAGERLLVNPGSVGQPREWRALVRFAVVELGGGGAGVVELRALRYDHASVRAALVERSLPPDACHRRPSLREEARRRLARRRR